MYHYLFIHSLVDRNLGCFQFLAIMSKVPVNIHVCVFVSTYISTHMDEYYGTQVLDHMVRLCLALYVPIRPSSKWLYRFAFSSE